MVRSAALAFLILGACGQSAQDAENICSSLPVKLPRAAETSSDYQQEVYYCIEIWSARLAQSPDEAPMVARAVVANCSKLIDYYQSTSKAENIPYEGSGVSEYWHDKALFRVIQARAGKCHIGR